MGEEKKIQVTIQLDPEFVDKVDDLAKKLKLKRSQMMRNLMESGYEDAVIMDNIGVFKAVQFGNSFMKKLKELALKGKITMDEKGKIKLTE